MDVLTLARILLRRWYVLAPVLALTAVGVYLVSLRESPTYTARGSMIIADPELQTADEAAAGTVSAADVAGPSVLAEVMADAEIVERIAAAGGSEDYTVMAAGEDGLLRVTGIAENEGTAIETVDLVLAELAAEAERRQSEAGISDDEAIAVETLSSPAVAVETTGEQGAQYEAVGSARLSGRFAVENPYESSSFSFAVLKELVTSEQGRAELAREGAAADYDLTLDESIMRVTVTGVTPQVVSGTYDALVEDLGTRLEERQVTLGIPSAERTRLQSLAEPMGVTADRQGLVRPLVTIAGLGIVVALGLTLLFDNVMTSLADRRRQRPDAQVAVPQPVTAPPDNGTAGGDGRVTVPRPLRRLSGSGPHSSSGQPAAPRAQGSRRAD